MRTLYAVSFPKFTSNARRTKKDNAHKIEVRADSPDEARNLASIKASAEGIYPKILRTEVVED